MGFHLRKSFKCGPFRFNLSNSGLGISTGVKGLRVGIDGKGRSYIGGGIGPIRYREYATEKNKDINYTDNSTNDIPQELTTNLAIEILIKVFCAIPAIFICLLMIIALTTINEPGSKPVLCILLPFFFIFIIPFLPSKNKKMKNNLKMALEFYKNNDFLNAIEYFKMTEDLFPKKLSIFVRDWVYEKHFECLEKIGNHEDALDLVNMHYISGSREKIIRCYFNLKMWDKLINFIQTKYTETEKNDNPAVFAILAECFLESGKKEIALETMLSGPIGKRSMNMQMCAFRYTLGKCYEANNDIKSALKQYRKVYSFDTTYEDVSEKITKLSEMEDK